MFSHTILALCSLPQTSLCLILVIVGKPQVSLNLEARVGMIVLECSGTSPIWAVCIFAYLGTLAGLCLCLALKGHALDSQNNELKFNSFGIIFGLMVGLTFVPAYYSTQGKFRVVIQAFSIIAIAYGILGCVFFPTCYTILSEIRQIK